MPIIGQCWKRVFWSPAHTLFRKPPTAMLTLITNITVCILSLLCSGNVCWSKIMEYVRMVSFNRIWAALYCHMSVLIVLIRLGQTNHSFCNTRCYNYWWLNSRYRDVHIMTRAHSGYLILLIANHTYRRSASYFMHTTVTISCYV